MPQSRATYLIQSISKRLPLRTALVIPFMLLIILVVGLTGYFSYHAGQTAVDQLVNQLKDEVSDRVNQKLHHYLEIPQLITRINAEAVRQERLDLNDTNSLRQYLWAQFQQFNDIEFNVISYLSLTSNQGNYVGLGYMPRFMLTLDIRDLSRDTMTRTWKLNDWGDRTKLTKELADYNPVQRPWFQRAKQVGRQTWIEPYILTTNEDIVLSVERPLYDRQGSFLGVASGVLSLVGISQDLQRIEVGKTGQVFIIEPNGSVIATSTGEMPFRGIGDRTTRLHILESGNPLTLATARSLQQKFTQYSNINRSQQLELWLNQHRYFIRAQPFRDNQGLDWLVVTVIPEADFMGSIHDNLRNTILLCLIAAAIAIALGILTTRWITRPLTELIQATNALSQGNWDTPIATQRNAELGKLITAFTNMRTELRHSQERLQEYSTELEQKNAELANLETELRRQLNLFLHAVSHDLRNPVIGVGMVLDNLQIQPGDEIKIPRRTLERMQASNQRQLDLINSLTDTHASEIWGVSLNLQPVNLPDIVEAAIADLQPLITQAQAHILNQIPAHLPLVNADRLQLTRVYQNLISNALKHNPPHLTLSLTATLKTHHLHCTVTDNGIGIPASQQATLFNPYVRGNQKPRSIGLGLGLYLCQQIIQAHGGKIGVNSQPTQGTTFWFNLPIANS